MEFAKVNYGLNQTYFVETPAFEKIVRAAVAEHEHYRIDNIEVIMDQAQANVKISLKLSTTKKTISYAETVPKISKSINDKIRNLIDVQPTNINIQIKVGR